MEIRSRDRIAESSTTTGTSDFTVAGALSGCRTFGSALQVGDPVEYYIEMDDLSVWEVGIGRYSASNTLARDRVIANSSGNTSLINFGSGTKNVSVTATQESLNIMGRVYAAAMGMAGP